MQGWLDIAAISSTLDFNGSFAVKSAPGLPFLLREGLRVALVPPVLDMPRNVHVSSVSGAGYSSAKVRFSEVGPSCDVERLVGCHCLVKREEVEEAFREAELPGGLEALTDADIRSIDELVGWRLLDESGRTLGEVSGIEENPAHLILKLTKAEGGEALIPLVDDFILEAESEVRALSVKLPKGLLDV